MTRVRRFSTPATEMPWGQVAGPVAEGRDLPAQHRKGAATAAGMLVALAVALSPTSYFRLQGIYLTASDAATILAFLLLLANHRLPLHFLGPATGYWFVSFLLFCGVIALLFGEFFLPQVVQEKVLNAQVTHDLSAAGTFEDRAYLLGEALEMARVTQLIGLGVDQYREISAFGAPLHNLYLLVLTEGGAVSLFGLVSLLLTGVFVAVQAICADHSRKVGALTLTVLLIFALLLNMFPTFYDLFWNVPVILAIAFSASRLMEFPETPYQDKRTISLGEKPFWRMER